MARSPLSDVPPNSTLRWLIDHLRMPLASLVGKTMRATRQLDGLQGGTVRAGETCIMQPKYGKSYSVRNTSGVTLTGPFAAHLVPTEETCAALGLTTASFPIWGAAPGGIILNATATTETEHAFTGVKLTAGPTRGRTHAQMYKVQSLSGKKDRPALKWFTSHAEALEYKNSTVPVKAPCT